MTLNHTSLSKDEIRAIIINLQKCAEVIGRHQGEMTAMELAFKSTLGALMHELREQLRLKEQSGA